MLNWKEDKRWSDQFLTEVKSILGIYLIGEPPIEEDQEHNTDLIVLKMDAIRIGVRIRRTTGKNGINYLDHYKNEFTIRSSRPNGNKTELAKIIEGWGDYFFYGFGDNGKLVYYHLCDLNVFRLWYTTQLYNGIKPGLSKFNSDNSSGLLAFNFNDLPTSFIIASSPCGTC